LNEARTYSSSETVATERSESRVCRGISESGTDECL
jgi:hypothetical protein